MRVGDVFDRYTIEGHLGEGGMGQVFRALDTRLQRKVALKIVLPSGDDDVSPQSAQLVLREARAAAAIDHPSVIAIFDVGEVAGVPFIAMELVDGAPLRKHVGDPSIALDQRIRWLLDVGRALDAAHRRGLVHRDVKPENVMIRAEGGVKVLDFGIARRKVVPVDATASTSSPMTMNATREGALVGTPLYMAPEQMRGEPVDASADQFAFGVMAYELLAGKHPWLLQGEVKDLVQLAAQICSQEAAPLRSVAPTVPPAVEDAIGRMMEKTPAKRFASMAAVVEALEPFAVATALPFAATEKSRSAPSPGVARVVPDEAPVQTGPTGTVPAGRAPKPSRPVPMIATAVVVMAVALFAARSYRQKSVVTVTSVTSSASASVTAAAPRTVLELPVPPGVSAEAAAAYRAGLQGYRDGKWREAVRPFERAAKVDPGFAAAHLRAAALGLLRGRWSPGAKTSLDSALSLRTTLSPDDAVLLDALEPLFHPTPELHQSKPKLERAVAARPKDPELRLFLAHVLTDLGELDKAEVQIDAALAIDPLFGSALDLRGSILEQAGRMTEAIAAWDKCIAAAPGATSCLRGREGALERVGDCARAETDLRALIGADEAERSYRYRLARVLYARGQSHEAVELALKQFDARGGQKDRSINARMQLALLEGDFAAAEVHEKALVAEVAASTEELDQAWVLGFQLSFAEERGEPAQVVPTIDRYLKNRAAWVPQEDKLTFEPQAWNTLRHAKRLSDEAFVKQRDGWVVADAALIKQGGLSRHRPFYAWLAARAWTADTKEEAVSALAAMPGTPPQLWDLDWQVVLGRTLTLAGRAPEALPHLSSVSKSCQALDDGVMHTWAFAWQARAKEASATPAEACSAWQVVLDRWGKAPRSQTGALAKARYGALGCATKK